MLKKKQHAAPDAVKTCRVCSITKPVADFYRDRGEPAYRCKDCHRVITRAWEAANKSRRSGYTLAWQKRHPHKHRAEVMRRYATKRRAIPAWANPVFVADMYVIARLVSEITGQPHHVDHMVPLSSELVCGLHVENNLQVITESANHKKKNNVWPEMP